MTHGSQSLTIRRRAGDWSSSVRVIAATTKAVSLTLLLVALWSITHVYRGITGDAELYAVQALSRIRPALATDLYLRFLSQDRFTVFSPFYAWCIRGVGLQTAALGLELIMSAWFLVAAWVLARRITGEAAAFLAVAALIILKGTYGSSAVFSYSENWLTARTFAEAFVVTALACHYAGRKNLSILIAVAAMAIHPIMALPGLLLLLSLRLPLRTVLIGAALGIAATAILSCTAALHPTHTGPLAVMDGEWLEVVRERSQFLLLQYWDLGDWEVNSRPFLCLTLSAVVLDGPIRRFCIAAMIVGAAGLAVAAIAGCIGPVALLVQGQAWRWMWVTGFASVMLLAPTAMALWRDARCGPLCALLLVLGWTFSIMDRDMCAALALVLWLVRSRLSESSGRYLKWAAVALAVVAFAWTAANSWTIAIAPSPESGRDPLAIADLRNIFGLGTSAALLVPLLYYWIRTTRSLVVLATISATLGAGAALALPGSLMQNLREGSAADINEFADWRAAIPPGDAVYVAPAYNSAAFAWLTLERTSYLSVDQSAGVVFSRETALEVKRRSQVLLPILDPDWRLLSRNQRAARGEKLDKTAARPLTREMLLAICRDPELGFVIAKELVGFEPLRHAHPGEWKDFYLYNCHRVRALDPAT